MADWSEVGGDHVRAAMAKCDEVGSKEFLARYRVGRARDASLWHGGQEYDARAVLALAYLRVTGNAVPSAEFATGGEDGAVQRLKALGFDVVIDETLTPAPPKAKTATTTARRTSKAAAAKMPLAPKRVVVKPRPDAATMPAPTVCPRCFVAVPSTGVCDNCD